MSTKKAYIPTLEQIALAAKRKAKREQLAAEHAALAPTSLPPDHQGRFLSREWMQLRDPGAALLRVKIMTWNLLAQCLVRRSLFPTSTNCLKASQRQHMTSREILSHGADILCLQESEVDGLEKLLPVLEKAGYAHVYMSGPKKNHGCLIAWSANKYTLQHESRCVQYDEEEIRTEGDDKTRRGSSFLTKNIAALVALTSRADAQRGLVIATTHLFWHPKYNYERTRQAGILFREATKFRDSINCSHWPCLVAGDFNFTPDDPAYSLLTGDPLTAAQDLLLTHSRVVHRTIDPTIPQTPSKPEQQGSGDGDGDDGGHGSDHDKVMTGVRLASPADGLLSTPEFAQLFAGSRRKSAYDIGLRAHMSSSPVVTVPTYGARVGLPPTRRGAFEPEWTSYAHWWKTVLDYIFVIDPPAERVAVCGLMKPHRTQDMEPGLPQLGVCSSDHVSLSAELVWEPKNMDCDP